MKFFIINLVREQEKQLQNWIEKNNLGKVNYNDVGMRIDYESKKDKQKIINHAKENIFPAIITETQHQNPATGDIYYHNNWLTFPEATEKWGLSESALRKAKQQGRFREREISKPGRDNMVTESAMRRLYGDPK